MIDTEARPSDWTQMHVMQACIRCGLERMTMRKNKLRAVCPDCWSGLTEWEKAIWV